MRNLFTLLLSLFCFYASSQEANTSRHKTTGKAESSIVMDSTMQPVQVTSFAGIRKNGGIELVWQASGETGLSIYEVQHSSNGTSFRPIGSLVAHGDGKEYRYPDPFPDDDQNFYRLKMVDRDGKHSYSAIVRVKMQAVSGITIYPNPARNTVNVQWTGPELNLVSQQGKSVRTIKINHKGVVSSSITIGELPRGVYYFQAGSERKKLMKE